MSNLEVTNLCFQKRGPYSFRVHGGECVGLQGASGAGKSLLLRAIADLDPRTGSMQLGDINAVGDHFVDFEAIDPNLLAAVGFDHSVRTWQISRLSTGEKQRLAIVRLLHNRPPCLLLDEPTASLDQISVARVGAVAHLWQDAPSPHALGQSRFSPAGPS